MAQSELNAANWALRLMGSRKVLAALSDTTQEGLACNAMIDDTKKSLLRMHPWNFATKRLVILPYADYAISNVTYVSSQLIEVTHASFTFTAGQYATITGVSGATGANGTWEVASVPTPGTVTRFTVPNVTSSGILGTYTASDLDFVRRTTAFDWSYLYALPTGCLRVLELGTRTAPAEWLVEDGGIVSQSSSIPIKFIKDITDYTAMDVLFYRCLAHLLAYDLCDALSASDGKKNELHVYLYGGQGKRGILPQSRFVDATEDSQQIFEADDWILSRNSSPSPTSLTRG